MHQLWLARQRVAAQAPSYGERFQKEMATLKAGRESDEDALRRRMSCCTALKYTAKSLVRYDRAISAEHSRRMARKAGDSPKGPL